MPKDFEESSRTEQWQALTQAGGIDNALPPGRVAPGDAARKPWSLTEEFNRQATKPPLQVDTPHSRQQVAELRQLMERAAAAEARGQAITAEKPIASKQAIEALRKMLSQPKHTAELTPLGSVVRGYNPDRDRKLVAEINRMQAALNQQRGKAAIDFNQASGIGR